MNTRQPRDENLPDTLIAIECFLHRIFPAGFYGEETDRIVRDRLFKPRKDCPEVALKTPLDWEAKAHLADRNWRMQLQGWAGFQPIMNFFDTYDDKQAIIDYFFDLAGDWWVNYGGDANDIVTSRMPDSYAWYDMSVGFRALVIAFFANRISAFDLDVSAERKAFLTALGRKHIANLRAPQTFSLNNHGIFQAQGLMGLLHTLPRDDSFEADTAYASDLMERLVTSQFDANGFHNEHSPHYHFYVLSTFLAVIKSGWFDDRNQIVERVRLATEAQKWLVDPRRRPICVGDSFLIEQETVIYPKAEGKPFLLSDFNETGYAVLRSDWDVPASEASMVFLMGAYHSKTHKHRDCLSFDWFEKGHRVLCDGGKYGYKSDKFRNYVLSYKAHNTAEIEGFDILKIKPYGSAIEPSKALAGNVYRMQAKLDFPAIKHKRTLFIKPGHWLIVQDHLGYARPRTTTLWFHLETDFRLVGARNGAVQAKGIDDRRLYIDCLAPEAHLELQIGNEAEMKGFVSSNDYEISPALTLGYTLTGHAHAVCTVFALDAAARGEAMHFAAERLDAELPAELKIEPDTPQVSAEEPAPVRLLPNVPHYAFTKAEQLTFADGKSTYTAGADGVDFSFFYERKTGGLKKLLVMLPGASARKNGPMDFQRYAWSGDFPKHDVIAFTDPSLKPQNSLGLAWFQNSKDAYGIAALATLMRRIIALGGYDEENVVFFGSSGGGFGVLQLADAFPNSKVIALNPQMFLYNYNQHHYDEMIKACYPGMTDEQVRKAYPERIAVRLNLKARVAPTYIFQNVYDHSHVERHLKPFLKNLDPKDVRESKKKPSDPPAKLNVVFFEDRDSGHAPPSRQVTVEMLLQLL